MIELNNAVQHLRQFRMRIVIAGIFVFSCFALLAGRLAFLQFWHYRRYAAQADENRISIVPVAPSRGMIIDRNGVVLAENRPAYTLEITASKIDGALDDMIGRLSSVVAIGAADKRRFKKLLEYSKSFHSLPIRLHLTEAEVARFVVQRFRFPGVEVRTRWSRRYPLQATAAHAIGYVGRISAQDQARIAAASARNEHGPGPYDPRLNANNYKGSHTIGKTGIEQSYQTELHGQTGFEAVEVTAGGRPVRTLWRSPATPGNRLGLTLDSGLQQAAERAFAGRRGALVAIEPATGEILAFVSAPGFDPNLFVDGIDQIHWDELNTSPDRPLLNRALRGTYPPGSTYKPFMALAALTLGKRTPQWGFYDSGRYTLAGHVFRDDKPGGHGWVNMARSIVVSCGTYYYILAHEMGVNAIAEFMKPWGFGQLTGVDLEGEARGVLPSTEWKKRAYRRPAQQKWYEGETISLGVGQGYNAFTMLQLAHAVATLANHGVAMTPHLVRDIRDAHTDIKRAASSANRRINVKQQDMEVIKRAMADVMTRGTAAASFRGAPYQAAGKTGTAQVYSLRGGKYHAYQVARERRDHALFIAFAPLDQPVIALALIVENGGWAWQSAAPIARQTLDYYLVDRFKTPLQTVESIARESAPGSARGE
ncbi:Peptidoglycan glycosyltransferase (Penicillin-binding protein 2, PBP-2) [Candidatus Glomeribacter gigasporarum BEG34]|uniref:Peptidoglycan D,D-transpeptidase MrdA n=1 Tax=Candidatus Glomeribacter gigasporarum BEG34 TaxID=1070319 RepID=G2J7H8_9BURK|nr:penicillin-binding protein 2 [Candidatus Glomeribacter gigasporarum]CCD28723.1 Peptidoglycan glycosyltransferase (Penicillin-binding protein 2, PBP-2) [Candidatus Glomeribacter gigasporarum BEG34]